MGSYNYGYRGFDGSDFMAVFGMVLGFIAVFAIIAWAMSLVLYILRSIGLYKLSENRGMSGAGLAWIPLIGYYRIGSIADDIVARNGGKSYYRHILLIGGIINIVSGIASWSLTALSRPLFTQFFSGNYRLPYDYGYDYYDGFFAYWGASAILSVISIAVFVFTIIALNKIYKCYRPMSSTTWTVLSVIFPFMQSIFPFVIRNAAPVSEWGAQGYYPQQNIMQNPNWQTPPPPQYQPFDRQPPVNGGYPPQDQGWAPPPSMDTSYQPPDAPNPPEPWEIEDPAAHQPPRAPWEKNGGDN